MRKTLIIAVSFITILTSQVAYAEKPYCREFTRTIKIDGKKQQGYGTACMQPDGTWEIVSNASKKKRQQDNFSRLDRDYKHSYNYHPHHYRSYKKYKKRKKLRRHLRKHHSHYNQHHNHHRYHNRHHALNDQRIVIRF